MERRYKVESDAVFTTLINEWFRLDNPRFYNGSVMTNFKNEMFYFEHCDTRFKRGKYCREESIAGVIHTQSKDPRKDQHMSTFAHCQKWKKHLDRKGSVKGVGPHKVYSPYVYVELDRDSLEEAMYDAWLIARNFPYPQHMRFWHSGNKSIHIGVDSRLFGSPVGWAKDMAGRGKLYYNLAHKVAGDLRHNNGLSDPYFAPRDEVREVYKETFGRDIEDGEGKFLEARKESENLDPSLFSPNSLIRMPYSIHEKSNGQKIEVSLDGLMNMELVPSTRKVEKNLRPFLLDWSFECMEAKERPHTRKQFVTDSGMVTAVYSKYIEGFAERDTNSDGFISGLFNPLYKDTRPSCSVNLTTGEMHDFGSGETYDLPDFLGEIKGIGRKKAKAIIQKENYEEI
jgi:hypothetical protein